MGDWLALAGGALFVGGAVRSQVAEPASVFPLVFAFFLFGGLVTLVQAFLLVDVLGPMPALATWLDMAPWQLLLAFIFFIPTIAVIVWAPSRIGTGLFSILILAEIVFGTFSAGLLADDPFGWREAVGGSLMLLAGLTEILLAPGAMREPTSRAA